MKNSQEWFSIKELIDENLIGLPASDKGIVKKAERENWEKRQREGVKGKTFEYHYSSLPATVQEQLGFDVAEPVAKNVKNTTAYSRVVAEPLEQVPFYHTFASAGFGAVNTGVYTPDDYIGLSTQWLNLKGLRKSSLSFILAEGDSMWPTINNGDMILIDHSCNTPKDGKIYVVRSGDQLWVKRIQGIIGGIRLISDNKDVYDPVDVIFNDALDFEVIGQVVFVGHYLN